VCDPTTNNNCDPRIALSCLPVPNSSPATYKCSAPTVVPSGSLCGVVSGVPHVCTGNLYCNTTITPPVCFARVPIGGGCVASLIGECGFGLHCAGASEPNSGNCQPVLAAVCQ
jgi:hypothetical protein